MSADCVGSTDDGHKNPRHRTALLKLQRFFRSAFTAVSVAAGAALLGSCVMIMPSDTGLFGQYAGAQSAGSATVPAAYTTAGTKSLSERQRRILAAAKWMLGRTNLLIDGHRFNYDCTGTILAIYFKAGIDLMPYFNNVTGNGVTRLYRIAKARGLLYTTRYPQTGDIIFWDNTYDSNEDGKWDDPLTHAGIVLGVHSDGTIDYVHQNYARGIVVEHMNLIHPAMYTRVENGRTEIVNSPMRMRSQVYMNPHVFLAGQLYRDFGALYRLP
jgi:cell wall-associated NlpC family hydrolase